MSLKEKILEYFEENAADFTQVIEELDCYCGYLGDDRVEDMEYLDDIFCDTKPTDILYRAFYGYDSDTWTEDAHGEKTYGEFNPNRNYFYFNGYGNLVSTDEKDYSNYLDMYFVDKLIEEHYNIDNIPEEVMEMIELIENPPVNEYEEYRNKRQEEFNALPIFFAFNNEQFKAEMEKRGLTENDTDKLYKCAGGGFYLKEDSPKIKAFLESETLEERMKKPDFAIQAFEYEMENHEYAINYYQGDWDVCCCFCSKEPEYADDKDYADYLREDGHAEWIPFYEQAKELYYKLN